jgi:hypothetical protein
MQLHVDPVQIAVLILGFASVWIRFLRKDTLQSDAVTRLTEWSKKHDVMCTEIRDANTKMMNQLQVTTTKLAQIAESQDHRLDRIERLQDAAGD